MEFNLIDRKKWVRNEYFEHYTKDIPCTYSMTFDLDITKIINSNKKLYPTMIYFITRLVNKYEEFRTCFNENNELGVFDQLIPLYTIFHKDTETFSSIWTEYVDDYNFFYKNYEKDINDFKDKKLMLPKENVPINTFNISMIPWRSFSGFNLNLQKGYDYLLPIFTMGRYYKQKDKFIIPISIQVHHAVCDGFHLCRFINDLEKTIDLEMI